MSRSPPASVVWSGRCTTVVLISVAAPRPVKQIQSPQRNRAHHRRTRYATPRARAHRRQSPLVVHRRSTTHRPSGAHPSRCGPWSDPLQAGNTAWWHGHPSAQPQPMRCDGTVCVTRGACCRSDLTIQSRCVGRTTRERRDTRPSRHGASVHLALPQRRWVSTTPTALNTPPRHVQPRAPAPRGGRTQHGVRVQKGVKDDVHCALQRFPSPKLHSPTAPVMPGLQVGDRLLR